MSAMPERVWLEPDIDNPFHLDKAWLMWTHAVGEAVPYVPESALLAAEARVRELEQIHRDEMDLHDEMEAKLAAERDALVPLARFAHYDLVYESPFLAALPTKEQLAAALPILAREAGT